MMEKNLTRHDFDLPRKNIKRKSKWYRTKNENEADEDDQQG